MPNEVGLYQTGNQCVNVDGTYGSVESDHEYDDFRLMGDKKHEQYLNLCKLCDDRSLDVRRARLNISNWENSFPKNFSLNDFSIDELRKNFNYQKELDEALKSQIYSAEEAVDAASNLHIFLKDGVDRGYIDLEDMQSILNDFSKNYEYKEDCRRNRAINMKYFLSSQKILEARFPEATEENANLEYFCDLGNIHG